MRILAWARSALDRPASSAKVLAEFSDGVEKDSGHPGIARCLEAILRRSLNRPVVVITADLLPPEKTRESPDDVGWSMDRRAIATWLEGQPFGATAEAKLAEVFGGVSRTAAGRIAALVPVLSGIGSRHATVVIGRKRFRRLTDAERSLIAAVVGMATLLFGQARLRERLDVATAEAKAVKRLAESHERRARLGHYLNKGHLN